MAGSDILCQLRWIAYSGCFINFTGESYEKDVCRSEFNVTDGRDTGVRC